MSTVSYDDVTDTLTIDAARSGYDDAISVSFPSALVMRIKTSHIGSSGTTSANRDWNTIADGPWRKIVFNGSADGESFANDTGMDCAAYGNGGEDVLTGGAGDDTRVGGSGADSITGGDGEDCPRGGYSDGGCDGKVDTLTGGVGADTFYSPGSWKHETIGTGSHDYTLTYWDAEDHVSSIDTVVKSSADSIGGCHARK